jgi:hypothetical protein
LPTDQELVILLAFIATLITRVPSFRRWHDATQRQLYLQSAQAVVASPEVFESIRAKMAADGIEIPASITFEQMSAFLGDESRYRIVVPQQLSVTRALELARSLATVLAQRRWSLVLAQDQDFICSDAPVTLVPISPAAPRFFGYGSTDTEVIVPLTRRTAFLGCFDTEACIVSAPSLMVGVINHLVAASADRYLYTPAKDFYCVAPPPDDPHRPLQPPDEERE